MNLTETYTVKYIHINIGSLFSQVKIGNVSNNSVNEGNMSKISYKSKTVELILCFSFTLTESFCKR